MNGLIWRMAIDRNTGLAYIANVGGPRNGYTKRRSHGNARPVGANSGQLRALSKRERGDARRASIAEIRQGLLEGLAQTNSGDLAEGSGADAIRDAFRQARTAS